MKNKSTEIQNQPKAKILVIIKVLMLQKIKETETETNETNFQRFQTNHAVSNRCRQVVVALAAVKTFENKVVTTIDATTSRVLWV